MEKSFTDRVTDAKNAVSAISPSDTDALRSGCEPIVLVDPRPAEAIASTTGLIPGAECVSLDAIAAGRLPASLQNKAARIVTTCQAGPMAAIAAHELQKQGFSRVSYMDGGTQGWLQAGLPTVRA